MYSSNFVASVLVGGKIVREEGNTVKVPFGGEYCVRLRNKNNTLCIVDLYVDGELANTVGSLVLEGNSYYDVRGFLTKLGNHKKFQFVKLSDNRVRQPGELENGIIEARFYLQKQVERVKEVIVERPIYIYNDRLINPWFQWNQEKFYTDSTFTSPCIMPAGLLSANIVSEPASNYNCNGTNSKCSNGATIEGQQFSEQFETVRLDVESKPTIIRIKLMGYQTDRNTCIYCQTRYERNDKYCKNCGKPVNIMVRE